MRIILLGHSKILGGAGVAAKRISDCLQKNNFDVFELFLDHYISSKKSFYLNLKYLVDQNLFLAFTIKLKLKEWPLRRFMIFLLFVS